MKTGLLKNTNAQIGTEKKAVILNVRVTRAEKEKWQTIAKREGMTLSCWVGKVLNDYSYREGVK